MEQDLIEMDGELTDEQQARVDQLTEEDLHWFDLDLISTCTYEYKKVARVVGEVMNDPSSAFRGIPDIFYSQRITKLAEDGLLEHQGTLGSMRSCEVRLYRPNKPLDADAFPDGEEVPQESERPVDPDSSDSLSHKIDRFIRRACIVLASLPLFFILLPVLLLFGTSIGMRSWYFMVLSGFFGLFLSFVITIGFGIRTFSASRNSQPTKFWKILTLVASVPMIYYVVGSFLMQLWYS